MRKLKKLTIGDILKNLFLWVFVLTSVYPILWLVFYSFKTNEEIFFTNPFGFPKSLQIQNYVSALSRFNVPQYFLNSVIVTVFTVLGVTIFALMFSYATARMTWRLSNTARLYITFGMFIPVQVLMIPLTILIRDLHLTNTRISLILPYIAFNLSLACLIFYGFMKDIPKEMEESASIDGAGIFRTFFRIILPMVKPSISVVVIFTFLNAWNEFTMGMILISDEKLKTLPLGLALFQGQFSTDWGAMGAAMVIASVPTILIYLIFSERVEHALSMGSAVKG